MHGARCNVLGATCWVQRAGCNVHGAACSVPGARCGSPRCASDGVRARTRCLRAPTFHTAACRATPTRPGLVEQEPDRPTALALEMWAPYGARSHCRNRASPIRQQRGDPRRAPKSSNARALGSTQNLQRQRRRELVCAMARRHSPCSVVVFAELRDVPEISRFYGIVIVMPDFCGHCDWYGARPVCAGGPAPSS